MTSNSKLRSWVDEMAELCQPDEIRWCDGSQAEFDAMFQLLLEAGTAERLDETKRPGSYLVRSDPADVARVEDRTFICSAHEADAGPTNNWPDPLEMRYKLAVFFRGVKRGRALYRVPFSISPSGAHIAHLG